MKAVQKIVGARPHHVERGTKNKALTPLRGTLLAATHILGSGDRHIQKQDIKRIGVIDRVGIHLPLDPLRNDQRRALSGDAIRDESAIGESEKYGVLLPRGPQERVFGIF
jgi:hypothetical protein